MTTKKSSSITNTKPIESGPFCEDCGQECETFLQDIGEGPYEFWGQIGIHKVLVFSSTCCEAPVFHDATLKHPLRA